MTMKFWPPLLVRTGAAVTVRLPLDPAGLVVVKVKAAEANPSTASDVGDHVPDKPIAAGVNTVPRGQPAAEGMAVMVTGEPCMLLLALSETA